MELFRICLAISVLLFISSARSEPPSTQYLCVPDQSVGFRYNEVSHTWVEENFRTPEKYIVRRLKPGERPFSKMSTGTRPTWGVFEVGDSTMDWADCNDPDDNPKLFGVLHGQLTCSGVASFEFSYMTLRFQMTLTGNYVTSAQPESKSDTPAITIGRCAPF